jgi:serine/threonine-protein kinase HipA
MEILNINHCPGTLKKGHATYSKACLSRLFNGKKVSHILPYKSPNFVDENDLIYNENRIRVSISGVQEKFSFLLEKNLLRLTEKGEQGTYIVKPIPTFGKRRDQFPANEHLTMQIAKQIFNIETAENAIIFFNNGEPAYITKRFDYATNGMKLAQEDFASIAGRTPQTHGADYKYKGNYLELFKLMKKYVPAYYVEAPKLLKLIMFNYLFSNGDAHLKNFSLIETALGDYRLSPAYDLLNSRIHIDDKDFALSEGLLPGKLGQGNIVTQIHLLAKEAGVSEDIFSDIFVQMINNSADVERLIYSSFLDERTKRSYLQSYQTRLKKLL